MKAVPSFEVLTPSSAKEVVSILAEEEGRATLYAGGTDLMPMMKRGKLSPRKVVDLSGVPELSYVRFDGFFFRVGALTPIQDLAASPLIPSRLYSIRSLTDYFGSEATRHMATVGGNLASGGERDIPLILNSLDGEVKIGSAAGERTAKPSEVNLKGDELILEAFFPDWGEHSYSWFSKFEKRASNGIGVVTAAVSLKMEDNYVEKLRVVLNRVEGRTMGRVVGLEEELTGSRLSASTIRDAVENHVSRIRPSTDFRASSDFRKHVSKVLVRRGLEYCRKAVEERSMHDG
ncbi:MAG: FAD binding domain-containing protein [Candidatus Caldarchaeum sp.]|nr:FAD binding domain-containing protein [Candidatus Caldarchaeum sp.]MDW7978922.1 FAD binding domain-containing protein [Candidatus Caldarchaeum sp.]